jgi:hypothetical protein
MTTRYLAASFVALLCASVLHAQAKPDFSGTWIAIGLEDAERNLRRQETLHGAGLINQQTLESAQLGVQQLRSAGTQVIAQTATTITTRSGAAGELVATYNLDGSETRNSLTPGVVTTARPAWDTNRLVVAEATTYPDGRTAHGKRSLTLDRQGQLIVQVTTLSPVGVELSTVVTTYRKQ